MPTYKDGLISVLEHWKHARETRLNPEETAENLRCAVDIVELLRRDPTVELPDELWKSNRRIIVENETKEIKGLTEGRMVHYVLPDWHVKMQSVGEHRPAVVVKVWDNHADNGCVNLQVFMDGDGGDYNDGTDNVMWATSILHSDEKEPGTWHFIEAA